MFFESINKEGFHDVNLSALIKYSPDQILYYYYNSYLNLAFDSYQRLKMLSENIEKPEPVLNQWLQLIDQDLQAVPDLTNLKDNDFIYSIGPYYYPCTNTRFYFTKDNAVRNELSADDFAVIMALQVLPPPNQQLHRYHKIRKNAKKTAKNKGELIEDIDMCMASLKEINKLKEHIDYLSQLLKMRYSVIEQEELFPPEPDNLPEKPHKPQEAARPNSSLIPFSPFNFNKAWSKKARKNNAAYNRAMKIYFIRYREYEKACDRYKEARESWSHLYASFREKCRQDIAENEARLTSARKIVNVYQNILTKSFIHSDYQAIETLATFKRYLDTGRANDLQDCMNVYEAEKHWLDIKASQERIENTIYFLQPGNDYLRLVNQQANEMLENIACCSKASPEIGEA